MYSHRHAHVNDNATLLTCTDMHTHTHCILAHEFYLHHNGFYLKVILSKEQKQLIYDTVSNFEAYKRCCKKFGLDDAITYGAGMVLLFHGPPGTGKTMMANAMANKLSKKVVTSTYRYMHSIADRYIRVY